MPNTSMQFAETSFGKLAYRIDGTAHTDRLPLVLMTRFRGTMDDWDPLFIARLAEHRQIIRFDSAGVGRSNGETPDAIQEMANIAEAFIRAIRLPKVDLLGWSMGGMIAQQVALDHPALIGKLIIAGSGAGGTAEGPAAHPRVPEIATKATNVDEDFLFLFFTPTEVGRAAGLRHLARLKAQGEPGPQTPMASVGQQGKALGQWAGTRARLAELRLPILVANGVSDVMEPAYRSYLISQEAPNAKLVLYPDAGHAFLFQYIDEFTAEVARFLALVKHGQ